MLVLSICLYRYIDIYKYSIDYFLHVRLKPKISLFKLLYIQKCTALLSLTFSFLYAYWVPDLFQLPTQLSALASQWARTLLFNQDKDDLFTVSMPNSVSANLFPCFSATVKVFSLELHNVTRVFNHLIASFFKAWSFCLFNIFRHAIYIRQFTFLSDSWWTKSIMKITINNFLNKK